MTQICYLAHPIGGDVEGNLASVLRWKRWLQDHYPIIASTPYYTDLLIYNDAVKEERDAGMARDIVQLKRHDALIMVRRATTGVRNEAVAMRALDRPVYDLTHLGDDPPPGPVLAKEFRRWRGI